MNPTTTDGQEDLRLRLRAEALTSTYVFSTAVCGFADLKPEFHAAMATWIERDQRPDPDRPGHMLHCRNKLGMAPRGHLKSSIWTVADKLRRVTRHPNLRILISNETEDNITRWMNTMQAVVLSPVYQWLFPERVPDFDAKRKPRWNQTQLELRRTENWPQATIEGIPVGGASTSNHYDIIDNDDVVGKRARYEPSTMQKAIDHGMLCWSLLVNPAENLIHDVGTRWTADDYLNWRLRTTENIDIFKLPFWKPGREGIEALWNERFPSDVITQLQRSLGPEFFALQYENDPLAHGATDFDAAKLRSFRWAYRTQPNGKERRYVVLERPEHDGGDRWFPVDQMSRVQIMDAGLSPESKDARTANVVVGLVPGETGRPFDIVILRADAVKADPNKAMERGYEVYQDFDPMVWAVESFGAHVTYFYSIASRYPLVRISKLKQDTSRPKESRIREMYPFVDQGRVYVHRSEGHEFVKEFAGFPNGRTVDLLDAFAWAPTIWAPPQTKLTEEDELKRWRDEWRQEILAKSGRGQGGRSPITGY